jgi:hypothetical protein
MNCATADKSSDRRFLLWGSLVVLVGFGFPWDLQGAADQGQAPVAPAGETVVALKQVPVWELAGPRVRDLFLRGHYIALRPERFPDVQYPDLTSGAPLYGEAQFDDGSQRYSFRLALARSRPEGNYDLLYFDDNGDGDLTNDKPRRPSQEMTGRLARRSSPIKDTYFESVQVPFDFGPDGRQTVELLPCLQAMEVAARNSTLLPLTSTPANSRWTARPARLSSAINTQSGVDWTSRPPR